MRIILFYVLTILPTISWAQQEVIRIRGSILEIGILIDDGLDISKYTNIDGSPYINPEFIPAKINDIEKTQFIRFNVVDNSVEVQTKVDKIGILNLKNDCKIELLDGSNKRYRTAWYDNEGKRTRSFFEVIIDGEGYSLYRQERKKYLEEQEAEAFKDKLPRRFVDQAPLFFVTDFNTDSSDLLELSKKKKKFIAIFGKKGKTLEKYIKQERLDYKEKDDLVRIMNFVFSENK